MLDALIHVDPENDLLGKPAPGLPSRETLTHALNVAFEASGVGVQAVNIHYLRRGIDIEVTLPANTDLSHVPDIDALCRQLKVREIRLFTVLDIHARQ